MGIRQPTDRIAASAVHHATVFPLPWPRHTPANASAPAANSAMQMPVQTAASVRAVSISAV